MLQVFKMFVNPSQSNQMDSKLNGAAFESLFQDVS